MAKRPTVASLKKVTPENLANLGAERLAEILASVAATRPELKRRLRMELAAEQGPEHLLLEIDKRLSSLEASRSRVSWRQRPTFVRDLDGLRALIAGRLAGLDGAAALSRLWRFMDTARRVGTRVRDKDGTMAAVFQRAAGDIGGLVRGPEDAGALVASLSHNPKAWAEWLPEVLAKAPAGLAEAALPLATAARGALPGWTTIVRGLADAAGDVDAFRATFTDEALRMPSFAAEVARRLLGAGRLEEAGRLLEAAGPKPGGRSWVGGKAKPAEPDFDWESVSIEYLERSGQAEAAQSARWASFERTLSPERLRDFTRRLKEFDDVEAEQKAFEHAAGHADFDRALAFLVDWPALPEAARMIEARADEIRLADDVAHAWAVKLRRRHPAAAHLLLRKAAAAAFRRRDFATSERLTQEADSIPLG